MEKEFNPTRKDLLMVENLILDIKTKKSKLIERKIIIQNSLSDWKEKYKDVELNSKEYHNIKFNRHKLKEQFTKLEIELKLINDELNFKNKLKNEIVFHLANNKSPLDAKEDLDKLQAKIKLLKIKYSDFTKDRTRVASLRVMASEFMDELEKLLK